MIYQIPLQGIDESFDISILGVDYNFRLQWIGEPLNNWIFSFGQEGQWLLEGMALVTGVDLLAPLKSLNLGFSLRVGYVGQDTGITQSNLGVKYQLIVEEND